MSMVHNKALVRRFLDEVYNKGNLEVADALVAPNYTSHNELNIEVLGPRGIKQAAIMQRSAFYKVVAILIDWITLIVSGVLLSVLFKRAERLGVPRLVERSSH